MTQIASLEAFPQLETERLLLRQMTPRDARAVYRIFADEEVTRCYDLPTFQDIRQARQLIERQAERFEIGTGIRWGIARRQDNVVIGTCGFHLSQDPHRAEIGYDLARPFWGQGFMTEALRAVLAYGFESLGLNRVEALVMPGNEASRRLLARLGFVAEGTLREYAFFKGSFHDLICFSLLKRDYHGRAGDSARDRQS